MNDDQNQPGHILMVGWDLTERKVREAELGQAQKLQAVGQLASGIAHDINNNLAVILGYSEFLLGTSESFGDVVRQALAAIQDQSMDCANTVRRIQMFSRAVPRSQFSSFSVNDVIHEVMRAADVLGSARTGGKGSGIRVETHLAELSPVWAYRAGVKEALSNLVDNAVEALPEGGVISVKTSVREDDVVLEVSDNGVGIAPADVNRIFDAFFTTRGPASSGLGLSIAYNLITKQGGRISVASCPGEGTTFTIGLPNRTANASDSVIDDISGKRKGLSVLVIDDEPLVAEVFRTFLEASGNRVATCSNGSNGLEVFDQQQFDLALVDLGMPNIDGWEVSRRINRLRPDFPIIVATGWNVSVEDGREQGAQVRAVLKKPFGIQELDQAIEEALDGALV